MRKYENPTSGKINITSKPEPVMSLIDAIHILTEVHTREDHRAGFNVVMGVTSEKGSVEHVVTLGRYIQAWRALRYAMNKPTEPAGPVE